MNTTSLKNFFVSFSGIAVLLFLYFPLAVIVLFSFNADTVNSFPIQKFSLHWYEVLFNDNELLQSVDTSITIAIISTLVALIIGIPAAYAMHKYDFQGKKLIDKNCIDANHSTGNCDRRCNAFILSFCWCKNFVDRGSIWSHYFFMRNRCNADTGKV